MPWHDTEMDGRDGLTRRDALALFGGTVAGAWLLGRAELASGLGDGDYWAFADRCQRLLDDLWSPGLGHYQSGGRGETGINAHLLFTHAAAAFAGHRGAARQDERARTIAARLCEVPPWRPEGTGPPRTADRRDQTHDWGWGAKMDSHELQHVAIDATVVRGLAQAWLARGPLGLDGASADAIAFAIHRCATSPFYAYPALRLNQINWPLEIFHWAALVTGDNRLLHHETRLQLGRFADGLTQVVPPFRIPLTGPGYRFHYVPGDRADARANLDSPEYATTVCGVLQFYEPALRAGMDPLLPRQRAALLAWVERVLCGYFTHAGYLNWDTGASFRRWHQAVKFGLAQGALLGIACAPSLQPAPEHGRWARYLFDRGLALFDRWSGGGEELPPPVLFGVTRTPGGLSEARQSAARIQANAARAVTLGLGGAAVRGAAAAVRLRPRRRPSRGQHARVQHGGHGGRLRAAAVRRRRAGAAVRRRDARGRRHRRPPACVVRSGRPLACDGPRGGEPARTGAREPGAPAAATARGAARRRGAAGGLPAAAVRRGVPDARGGGRSRATMRSPSPPGTASAPITSRRAGLSTRGGRRVGAGASTCSSPRRAPARP